MTDLRRMFYNRYKTSSIFSTNNDPPSLTKDTTYSKPSFQNTFSPKYDKMTSKERYLREMRFDFKNTKKEKISLIKTCRITIPNFNILLYSYE